MTNHDIVLEPKKKKKKRNGLTRLFTLFIKINFLSFYSSDKLKIKQK